MTDQPPVRRLTWPTDEEAWSAFEAYVSAVGKVAHAWNYLHERLGSLFVWALKAPDQKVTAAVWYSTYSDRSQRDMLRAAILAAPEYRWASVPPSAKEDLLWLLDRANELGNKRDDAVHAPCSLYTDSEIRAEMVANLFSGHRRAINLQGKQLLVEFDWCERYAEALSRFTQQVADALNFSEPWPDKPLKPVRKPKKEIQGPERRPQIPK